MSQTITMSRTFKIVNERGLHARASHKFVQTIEPFDAAVTVMKDDMSVGGDEIMELLMLAASKGSMINVTAHGSDAEQLLNALEVLIANKFGEDK